MIQSAWRRIAKNLRNREYIDAYSIAFVAFGLAILSLVPDLVPDALKWTAVLGGIGLLVLRITIPDTHAGNADELLNDRFAFDRPLSRTGSKALPKCGYSRRPNKSLVCS